MARHFDIRAGQVDDRELVLEAPLASNFNDKQTAFAGTLASLCTLSGWAMTSLVCEEAGYQTDIAVIRSDVRYARPCSERIIRARCLWPAPEDAAAFIAALGEQSRAVLSVHAEVRSQSEPAVAYSGDYSAKILSAPKVR
jgi:thioesterase domain-containing protein